MNSITAEVIAAHQLTQSEYDKIVELLGRVPTLTELGIFSVMWSEHCSYKSSRVHLRKLPTRSKLVLVGPGENAGIIDIGDNTAIAFKIESHNHPSFIEPFQGAATGVGGILRDIFTMGARPIAVMDAIRFGPLDDPRNGARNRRILEGVVSGIAHYGNCFGVPTVGGECAFEPGYNGNPLVNVFALGVFKHDEIFYGRATGVGNPVIYVGAKTGRDGIHGATMASAITRIGSVSRPVSRRKPALLITVASIECAVGIDGARERTSGIDCHQIMNATAAVRSPTVTSAVARTARRSPILRNHHAPTSTAATTSTMAYCRIENAARPTTPAATIPDTGIGRRANTTTPTSIAIAQAANPGTSVI